MKKYFYSSLIVLMGLTNLCNAQVTKQKVSPIHKNTSEQEKKPYLILISADGFRYDYAKKYNAAHLLELAKSGVQAESMIPVFPAATLANHNSLVTGLYPVHTGIMGNAFYDAKRKEMFKANETSWYAKDQIWTSAEKQGMVTGSINFISSQQPVNGVETSYFFKYNKKKPTSMAGRVEIVKKWLSLPENIRPHMIALYNPETDHAGHRFGPDSKEMEEAVGLIDSLIEQLQMAIKETGLPVNVVFVSDHGMTAIDQKHHLSIPSSIDTAKFVVVDQGAHVTLHAKNKADIMPMYQKLKAENNPDYLVYLKKDLPKDLHFDAKEDEFDRIGDILLLAKWPKIFTKKNPVGAHGFNPYEVKDVRATFMAWGPAFKHNVTIKPFPNVEVYGMMMQILGLRPEPNDGTGMLNAEVLK